MIHWTDIEKSKEGIFRILEARSGLLKAFKGAISPNIRYSN